MSTPRIELALANLAAAFEGIDDCTVLADSDLPFNWDTATTTRAIVQRTGGMRHRTRVYQTVWTLLPVLELHVAADDHTTLRTKLITLLADVVEAIGADATLGGAAELCELAEEEPSDMTVNDVAERGAAAELDVPLTIVLATAPNDLTKQAAA